MRGTVAKRLRKIAQSMANATGKPIKAAYKILKKEYKNK